MNVRSDKSTEPAIGELDGVFLYDIDDLEKVVHANLAERAKAGEQAGRIVEHEAGQFEQWIRTQGVVPTIRALREHFNAIAGTELQKVLDQLSRKEHSPMQQREVAQRLVELVVNKLLHAPTTALRAAGADEAALRAEVLCDLFGIEPKAGEPEESARESAQGRTEVAESEPVKQSKAAQ